MTAHQRPRTVVLRAFSCLLLIVASKAMLAQRDKAVVRAGSLSVFADMSAKGELVTTLSPGKGVLITFSATNEEGKWCAVSDADTSEKLGFVRCDGLERPSPPKATFVPGAANPHPASSGLINPITSTAEENDLRKQWTRMFDSRSWKDLDILAERLRSARLRFEGGGWQLHVLYCIIGAGCLTSESDMVWESHIAALKEWIRVAPSSATPRIALADAYERFAWKARGTGFINTVSPRGWDLFSQRVKMARQVLEESQDLSRGDPEWYRAMITIASDQGWKGDEVTALVEKALIEEPGYFYSAREMANYLLPKWYGAPGDAEEFVKMVADRVGGDEGDANYFFVAEIVQVHEYKCNCSPLALSWPRVQRGYEAIQRLYGITTTKSTRSHFSQCTPEIARLPTRLSVKSATNGIQMFGDRRRNSMGPVLSRISGRFPSLPPSRRTGLLDVGDGIKGAVRFEKCRFNWMIADQPPRTRESGHNGGH